MSSATIDAKAFRGDCVCHGLLLDVPINQNTALAQRGVALSWLASLHKISKGIGQGSPVQDVAYKLLQPPYHRSRLFDFIPPRFTGPPQLRIVLPRGMPWSSALETALSNLKPSSVPGVTASDDDFISTEGADTHVWLDFVAMEPITFPGVGEALETIDSYSEAAFAAARECTATCSQGTLLVVDPNGAVLDEMRPLYDAWAACAFSGNNPLRLAVALPPEATPALITKLMSLVGTLDFNRLAAEPAPMFGYSLALANALSGTGATHAPVPSQRAARLLTDIKRVSGVQRASNLLACALARATRLAVRAAVPLSPRFAGLFTGMLLQDGQLRLALAAAQEGHAGHDTDSVLEEMKALFMMYDADGSGELDEEEIARVLADAGFGRTDASEMFKSMNGSKGGHVTLADFVAWWSSGTGGNEWAQRKQEQEQGQQQQGVAYRVWTVMRVRGKPTTTALGTSVSALVQLVQDKGLTDVASYVSSSLAKACQMATPAGMAAARKAVADAMAAVLVSENEVGEAEAQRRKREWERERVRLPDVDGGEELPPPKLAGGWQEAVSEALFVNKGNGEAVATAARKLYDALLANMDLLPYHPSDLPLPPTPLIAAPPVADGSGGGGGGGAAARGTAAVIKAEAAAMEVLATYLTACARSVTVAEAGDTGRRSRDSSNLLKAAADLRLHASLHGRDPGGMPEEGTSTLSSHAGQALVRDLVAMKYGTAAANRSMRQEAGRVVSQITAGAKTAVVGAGGSKGGGGNGHGAGSGGIAGGANAHAAAVQAAKGALGVMRGTLDSYLCTSAQQPSSHQDSSSLLLGRTSKSDGKKELESIEDHTMFQTLAAAKGTRAARRSLIMSEALGLSRVKRSVETEADEERGLVRVRNGSNSGFARLLALQRSMVQARGSGTSSGAVSSAQVSDVGAGDARGGGTPPSSLARLSASESLLPALLRGGPCQPEGGEGGHKPVGRSVTFDNLNEFRGAGAGVARLGGQFAAPLSNVGEMEGRDGEEGGGECGQAPGPSPGQALNQGWWSKAVVGREDSFSGGGGLGWGGGSGFLVPGMGSVDGMTSVRPPPLTLPTSFTPAPPSTNTQPSPTQPSPLQRMGVHAKRTASEPITAPISALLLMSRTPNTSSTTSPSLPPLSLSVHSPKSHWSQVDSPIGGSTGVVGGAGGSVGSLTKGAGNTQGPTPPASLGHRVSRYGSSSPITAPSGSARPLVLHTQVSGLNVASAPCVVFNPTVWGSNGGGGSEDEGAGGWDSVASQRELMSAMANRKRSAGRQREGSIAGTGAAGQKAAPRRTSSHGALPRNSLVAEACRQVGPGSLAVSLPVIGGANQSSVITPKPLARSITIGGKGQMPHLSDTLF